MSKICSKCKQEKSLDLFPTQPRRGKPGYASHCKVCRKEYQQAHRKGNLDKIKLRAKNHYERNKDVIIEKAHVYYYKNRDKILEQKKEYYSREEVIERKMIYRLAYEKERLASDVCFKLAHNLRRRMYRALVKGAKRGSAVRDLGCTIEELKTYLQSKFIDGMRWDNYGSYWHIDHIIPLTAFDLTDRAQFLRACHYTNLQPLEAIENIKKGNKLPIQNHDVSVKAKLREEHANTEGESSLKAAQPVTRR